MAKEMSEQIGDLLGEENELDSTGESESDKSSEEAGSENLPEGEESSKSEGDEEISSSEGGSEDDSEEGESSEEEGELSELEQLKKDNESLRAEIEKVSTPAESKAEAESEKTEETEQTPIEVDFLENHNFDDIIESEDSFKSFLSDFANKIRSQTHEAVLQSLPDTVAKFVQDQVSVQSQVNQFYEKNPDLAGTKKYVSVIGNQVQSEHPDWSYEAVLDETATRARKNLGLKQQAQKPESGQKKNPGFASGTQTSSKKNTAPELSQMEKEIKDLIMEEE